MVLDSKIEIGASTALLPDELVSDLFCSDRFPRQAWQALAKGRANFAGEGPKLSKRDASPFSGIPQTTMNSLINTHLKNTRNI